MTKPNWSDWLLMPDVKVWEACVLSIGLEPESMKGEDFGWMDDNGTGPYFTRESFPNPEAEKKYKSRLKVLGRNLSDRNYFSAGVIAYGKGAGLCSVRLDEFASWATSKAKWLDLPPELAALVIDKSNSNSTPTEFKVQPESVVGIGQSCIDEDAANELLANLPEVNPSSECDIALAGDVQAAGGQSRATAKSENGETSAMELIGQKGRQANTDKRLSHINATNHLGDNEQRILFNSLEEAQASIVLRYAALQAATRLNDNDAVLGELHRLIGCDTLGDPLYSLKSLKSNITKWRTKV